MSKRYSIILSLLIACFSNGSPLYADSQSNNNFHEFKQSLALGKVDFEVTTKNELAKEHFLLGTLFLHAFMYDLAIRQFQLAQELDPGFAMSYWGEAMANKHPIWNYENLIRAQKILQKYKNNQDNPALSDKEKSYLAATAILFSQKSLLERDTEYLAYMEHFYQRYPNDANIGAFYALALLGMASDFPNIAGSKHNIEKGRTLISKLFKQFPNHTGVVHYFIHYHDINNVSLAKKAIPAANIALKTMSSSSHVTHMAAHIYRQLGYWDDFILANLASINAADKLCSSQLNSQPLYSCNAENKYHSLEWLHYGYLKKNQFNEANRLVEKMATIVKRDPAVKYKQWYYSMWARQLLESKDWQTKPIRVEPITKQNDQLYWSAYAECGALLAAGFRAAHHHQSTDYYLKRLDTIISYTDTLSDPYIKQSCQIAKTEIQTEIALIANKYAAMEYMRQALAIEQRQITTEVTPSLSFLPVQKYYGDYLTSLSKK